MREIKEGPKELIIPGFFDQIEGKLAELNQESLEGICDVYLQILRIKESLQKTRGFSLKSLKNILRSRGFSFQQPRQSHSKEWLKTLIFLIDLSGFHYRNEFSKETASFDLIMFLRLIEAKPDSPFKQFVQRELTNLLSSPSVKPLRSNEKSLVSLEINLIPVIIYVALLKSKTPVFVREIHSWLKTGTLPYLSPASEGQELRPSNVPSVAFLRKQSQELIEKLGSKARIPLEELEHSLSKRVLEEAALPLESFHAIFLTLINRLQLCQDGIKEVALCAGLIFLLKLFYGLNSEAYTSLLKPDEISLIESQTAPTNLSKAIEIRDVFKKSSQSLQFLDSLPPLDFILQKMQNSLTKKEEKPSETQNDGLFLSSFDDLKKLKLNDLVYLRGSAHENQEFSDLTSRVLHFEQDSQTEKIKMINQKGEEPPPPKREISSFLVEELDFLSQVEPNHLKATVFPLPSSRFFLRNGLAAKGQLEFCLVLDFFADFLDESPQEVFSELRKIEKLIVSHKF